MTIKKQNLSYMKKFTITSTTQMEEYVTYTVEAETAEEALEMVENGEVEDNGDHWMKDIGGGPEYEITSEEEPDEEQSDSES